MATGSGPGGLLSAAGDSLGGGGMLMGLGTSVN